MTNFSASLAVTINGTAAMEVSNIRQAIQIQISGFALISAIYLLPQPGIGSSAFFTGNSNLGLSLLGRGPINSTVARIEALSNTGIDKSVGVVRWGYSDPPDGDPAHFYEAGWDYFRSTRKIIDWKELPAGTSLEVWARFSKVGIGWDLTISDV